MIEFRSTVHGTLHAFAVVPSGERTATVRRIAAQARGKGATGPALRKQIVPSQDGSTVGIRVAYREV